MSIQFFIRKQNVVDRWRWTLRDALCSQSDTHDFDNIFWTDDCDGKCDTFIHFSSAIMSVWYGK